MIEQDDKLLGGSLVIAEYVDEVYSKAGGRTLSSDSYLKARTNMLIADKFGKVRECQRISAIFYRCSSNTVAKALRSCIKGLGFDPVILRCE